LAGEGPAVRQLLGLNPEAEVSDRDRAREGAGELELVERVHRREPQPRIGELEAMNQLAGGTHRDVELDRGNRSGPGIEAHLEEPQRQSVLLRGVQAQEAGGERHMLRAEAELPAVEV